MTAYWLSRCDGFRVVGRKGLEAVEGAVYDEDPLRPVALRVRRRRGTRLVPVEAVEAVCPLERVLYLRRRPSRASRSAARAGRATGAGLVAASRAGSRQAMRGSRAAAVAGRRHWPAVRQALALAGQTALALAVLAAVYTVSVAFAAARALRTTFVVLRRNAPRALADASLVPARRTFR